MQFGRKATPKPTQSELGIVPTGSNKLDRLMAAGAALDALRREYKDVLSSSYYYVDILRNELDSLITKETVVQIKAGRRFT